MIITIAHQKGGVGKSTIATNLAVETGIPIIDLDSQHSCYLFSILRKESGKSIDVYTPEIISELKEILSNVQSENVIIDSGGYDNDVNRYALLVSDIVITPVSPSQIEVFGLQKFSKIITEAQKHNPELKVFVVINNADPRSTGENRELEKFIESEKSFCLLKTKLYRRADYRRAYAQGLSVCEFNSKGKACKEIKDLIREIKNIAL